MRSQLTVEPMIVAVDNIDDPSDASQFATELFTLWAWVRTTRTTVC